VFAACFAVSLCFTRRMVSSHSSLHRLGRARAVRRYAMWGMGNTTSLQVAVVKWRSGGSIPRAAACTIAGQPNIGHMLDIGQNKPENRHFYRCEENVNSLPGRDAAI